MSEYNKDSILDITKCECNVAPDDDSFDTVLITYINSVIFNLSQIGVIPSSTYTVTSKTDTWTDLGVSNEVLGAVKTYLPKKVHMAFDAPSSTNMYNALDSLIKVNAMFIRIILKLLANIVSSNFFSHWTKDIVY